MHQSARRLLNLVDRLRQQAQVLRVVDQARAAQQQVVVVAGEAFKKPQHAGVVFLGVIKAFKLFGLQALDVPSVEVFMADQAQQGGVALGLLGLAQARQIAAAADQRSAIAVLQPAVAIVHRIEHEHIFLKGGFGGRLGGGLPAHLIRAVPKQHFCFHNLLRVSQQAFAIKAGRCAADDKLMLHAAHIEAAAPELADLKRRIGQFVVIGEAVAAQMARSRLFKAF